MAIKVQVKETGSTKTQSNMFSNGATFASNSYDFVGVQPAAINGLNAMNGFVSANAMNPFVTPLAFPNMPYARQNTIFGQLPGVGQQTLPCSGMMTTPAALNPMFAATANTAIAAHRDCQHHDNKQQVCPGLRHAWASQGVLQGLAARAHCCLHQHLAFV